MALRIQLQCNKNKERNRKLKRNWTKNSGIDCNIFDFLSLYSLLSLQLQEGFLRKCTWSFIKDGWTPSLAHFSSHKPPFLHGSFKETQFKSPSFLQEPNCSDTCLRLPDLGDQSTKTISFSAIYRKNGSQRRPNLLVKFQTSSMHPNLLYLQPQIIDAFCRKPMHSCFRMEL